MTKEELLMGSVDLVSKTYIELGQNNVEEDTIMVMAQSLADDLLKTYKNFYFEDAKNAFNLGVRSLINNDFIHLNVPTYILQVRYFDAFLHVMDRHSFHCQTFRSGPSNYHLYHL